MPVYSGNYSMKKFNKIKCFSYVFTVILALGFVLTACEKPAVTLTTPESVNGFKLNTFVQIDSYTSVSKNTLTEALNLCDYYENIFSRTKEDSELSKVNSNQTTSISKEMYELVSAGLEYAALSNGAFDITIGSVSRLWDFTAESPKVPDSGRIAEALTHVDYTRVSVSDNGDGTYSISKPDDVILDLGAVAKGYIADKIKDFLEENGVKRAIINLGGNSLIVDTYRRIYSQSQQFRIYSLTTQRRFDDSVTEHRSIVENICSGNWKEADRVNKIHLALAREEIIQHFESKKAVEEEQENE